MFVVGVFRIFIFERSGASLCSSSANHASIHACMHPYQSSMRTVPSAAERKWNITEKEAYTVLWAVSLFKHCLLGVRFCTDNSSVAAIKNSTQPRLQRWMPRLEEYHFTITHRKGEYHGHVDARLAEHRMISGGGAVG